MDSKFSNNVFVDSTYSRFIAIIYSSLDRALLLHTQSEFLVYIMKHQRFIFAICVVVVSICDAFTTGNCRSKTSVATSTYLSSSVIEEHTITKSKFLQSLDIPYDLNKGCKERAKLLNDVIDTGGGLSNPGSQESFQSVAPGSWRVCYAPHMTFMSGLARGEFSVQVSL